MRSWRKLDAGELALESNPYYKDNPGNYLRLLDLISNNPLSYHAMLRKPEYGDLCVWVDRIKPRCLNDSAYRLATVCHWIIFGLTDFPLCDVCGRRMGFVGKNVKSVFLGYHSWCSLTCKANSAVVKNKTRETNLARSGFEYPA